ncbi:hypothetical protein HMPREF1317_1513 [Schaalia georgiae F0490]|uniref:Uncharacterized protein n=1 Tax=Schaalia georgiae F0490 TaxID=1125717 RepID=J1HJN5_9ACTO|nr:hypothetical protein HMPREF1317_1513 [Schaalia georgiae F0490]
MGHWGCLSFLRVAGRSRLPARVPPWRDARYHSPFRMGVRQLGSASRAGQAGRPL